MRFEDLIKEPLTEEEKEIATVTDPIMEQILKEKSEKEDKLKK